MPRIVQIQARRDSTAGWAAANPLLAVGEPGFDTSIGAVKIGDGATTWSGLPYEAYPNLSPTAANQSLVAGGQYSIGTHAVLFPNIGQDRCFIAVPSDGEWTTAGRGYDVPTGWTIVNSNAGPHGGRLAVFRCDPANSRYIVHC